MPSMPTAAMAPPTPTDQRTAPSPAHARLDRQLADLAHGQPQHIADFYTEFRKVVADAPDAQAAFAEVVDILADKRRALGLEQSVCLPGCADPDPHHETCNMSHTRLPIPDGLAVRENQLLQASIVRLRDPEKPEDEVFIQAGGNGTTLNPATADRFADELITFASTVRHLARQAATGTATVEARA